MPNGQSRRIADGEGRGEKGTGREGPRGRWDDPGSQSEDAVFVCWGGAGWRDAGGGARRRRGQGERR